VTCPSVTGQGFTRDVHTKQAAGDRRNQSKKADNSEHLKRVVHLERFEIDMKFDERLQFLWLH